MTAAEGTAPEFVTYAVDEGVAWVMLNRPQYSNAQNYRLLNQLDAAFKRAVEDDEVKVIVLRGDGKHFSAGHDIGTPEKESNLPRERVHLWWDHTNKGGAERQYVLEQDAYLGLCRRWQDIPKPMIAMVQGACVAGGLMLAWVCDLIVASDDAFFQDPVVRMAQPGVEYFAHAFELPPRVARELLLLGERMPAERAYQFGMVNRIYPRESLRAEVARIAAEIAQRDRFGLAPSLADSGLGTIGGGNHFAELQVVEEVRDPAAFATLSLDKADAALLIHSGSRALGQDIFREHIARHGAAPLVEESEAAEHYLARHAHALRFARANRALIAHRFAVAIGAEARLVSDVAHNMVTREDLGGTPAWFHRKGAASTREALAHGALMIPGSRGTASYLVRARAEHAGEAAWSLAHGAGRRWQRGYAKARLSHKYRSEDLTRTALGGRVICEDRELLYDEAPQAYKDIAQVIADLEAAGLIATVAVYRPVLTYKVRRAPDA